ncbi:hypothetical protein M0R45_026691 [Rubus argutus]|uniref:C3H1-type domain-containing protein n=1 Tax=Rubus argutus TaxID=59490 RepID=A0AAW1X1R7_RUBAR
MENLHSNSRVPKLSPQPLMKGSFENVDLDSPLLRYLRGSQSPVDGFKHRRHQLSPLSSVENLMAMRSPSPSPSTVYRKPARAVPTEEVLVMDGVLITGGKRSSRSASNSPSSSSSSSDSSGKILYKSGSKCQFVHGKENLRQTCFPGKNKSEAQMCKSTSSTGSCTPSPKSRFVYQVMASSAVTEAASSPKLISTSKTPITVISCRDWSPQDDGIEVVLPSSNEKSPSKADVDVYIIAFLHGPTTRMRLPVFAEICPE